MGLVEHQVVVAVADLFVDERGVVVRDNAAQQFGGLLEQHHVVLLQVGLEMVQHVGIDAQQVQVLADGQGAVVVMPAALIMCDGGFYPLGQTCRVGEIVEGNAQPPGVGRCELAVRPFAEDRHRSVFLPFEILGALPVFLHQRQCTRSDAAGFLLEAANQSAQLATEGLHAGLVVDDAGHGAHLEQKRLVEEVPGHIAQRALDIPVHALFHAVKRVVAQPIEQRGVGRVVHGLQHEVHHLHEHSLVVELHPVGGVLSDFAGKSAHHRLEKLVDGAHREAGIVVQHPPEPVSS